MALKKLNLKILKAKNVYTNRVPFEGIKKKVYFKKQDGLKGTDCPKTWKTSSPIAGNGGSFLEGEGRPQKVEDLVRSCGNSSQPSPSPPALGWPQVLSIWPVLWSCNLGWLGHPTPVVRTCGGPTPSMSALGCCQGSSGHPPYVLAAWP